MDSNKANKSLNSELISELLNSTKMDSKNDDLVDLERIFYRLLHRWYYFVVFLIITISVAYLYNRFTIPSFKVTSTLLFNNNDKNRIGSSIEAGSLMNGFGLNPGMQNMDNQINILSNYSLIKKCMSELPFDKEYYKRGKVNKSNLYPYSPFTVISDTIDKIPYGIEFTIQFLSDAEFHISAEENDQFYFDRTAKFGEILNIGGFIFHIKQSKIYWPTVNMESPYYFIFRDQEALIVNYQKRLTIEKMSREGTMVEISLEGINFREDKDFLSKLINEYLVSNLRKKNYEADRTIKFIDNQLKGISDSLIIAENKLQEFRSRNRVMNISSQGSQVLEQAVKLEDEKSRLLIQADYYNYLNDYLSKESATNKIIAPSTMGISDPTLIQLVGQLSELQAEYLSLGGREKPFSNELEVTYSEYP